MIYPNGIGSSGGYSIANALRFDGSNDYLSRTFSSTTDTAKWTWSGWVKKAVTATSVELYNAGTGSSDQTLIRVETSSIRFACFVGGATRFDKTTSAVYRDPSAWMHVVVVLDTANATAEDRNQIWVNGARVTATGTNYSSGTTPHVNTSGVTEAIGKTAWGAFNYFNGYLSDIYFIDGQALTPTSFGETNADGVWVPKAYTITGGTNSFHLDFADGTSTTTLGYDAAGSNDWTLSGFTRSAGVNECWMTDTPTNNFATLNPLGIGVPAFSAGSKTISNGNLDATCSSGGYFGLTATQAIPASGNWVWEAAQTSNNMSFGFSVGKEYGGSAELGVRIDGTAIYKDGVSVQSGLAGYTSANVMACVFDADGNSVQFYKDGSTYGSSVAYTRSAGVAYYPYAMNSSSGASTSLVFNFGQRGFAYSGSYGTAKALCTANLPTVTITNPREHFDVIGSRTGTAAAYDSATTRALEFAPGLVWIKSRGRALDHAVYDYVRGVQKRLETNNTDAEVTGDSTGLTSFDPDGYQGGALDQINGTTATNNFVDWFWRAGGEPTTDNVAGAGNVPTAGSVKVDGANYGSALAGTIAATRLSANTTAGFSIVTFTDPNTSNYTVGHGLGQAPKLVIEKNRTGAVEDWLVYHANANASPATGALFLDTTNAFTSNSAYFNNTAPTSTVFTLGAYTGSKQRVAYCFAEVPGFSKFGSYTGNGSTDGPFVHCGFRPKYVLIKRYDSTGGSWHIFDSARDLYNPEDKYLIAEGSQAEVNTGTNNIDFTASGFKLRLTAGQVNGSTNNFIFAAFSEHPNGSNVAPSPAR